MKWKFDNLLPEENPITSLMEYMEARQPFEDLSYQMWVINEYFEQQTKAGEPLDRKMLRELDALILQRRQLLSQFARRKPKVLVACCPYCSTSIWVQVGIFSLKDEFWWYKDDPGVSVWPKEDRCSHLFCVDGALNLMGYTPDEAVCPITIVMIDKINMAAEVPFVKARVLNLSGMRAVFHSFPVYDRYIAYSIAYFTDQPFHPFDFCLGWARTSYVGLVNGISFSGERQDIQEYDLKPWIKQDKLLWVDPKTEDSLSLVSSWEAFPYKSIQGRHNPYFIKDSQVQDLPNPAMDVKPSIKLEI